MKTYFNFGIVDIHRLAKMCGGTVRTSSLAPSELTGICTDSREADENTLFCAIRGERVDGHDYISAAIGQGCRAILCEEYREEITATHADAIIVDNVVESLSRLAYSYRMSLHCKTVAVTGSVGKTTTKDMIDAVLAARFPSFKTKGNFNSVIGMPLSMLEIPNNTSYAVLEMGMSGFGEIERLSRTAEPDIAIITTIGTSHMEKLGSRENICRAKLEVLCGLKRGGTLLLNGDEPLLSRVNGKSYNTLYISTERENADFFAKNIKVTADGTTFDIVHEGQTVRDLSVRVVGRHNVYSALFAFAVGSLAGMREDEIRAGLLRFAPEELRQNIVSVGHFTVMEDCYNASPESMKAAIDVLEAYARLTGGRSVAVLGNMLELGEESAALHRQVGAHLAKKGIEKLVALGEGGEHIAVGAKQCGMRGERIDEWSDADDTEGIGEHLLRILGDGDVVLFKASRGVRIERLIEYLKAHV